MFIEWLTEVLFWQPYKGWGYYSEHLIYSYPCGTGTSHGTLNRLYGNGVYLAIPFHLGGETSGRRGRNYTQNSGFKKIGTRPVITQTSFLYSEVDQEDFRRLWRKGMGELAHLEASQTIGKMVFPDLNLGVDKEPACVGCRAEEKAGWGKAFAGSFSGKMLLISEKEYAVEIHILLRLTKASIGLHICLLGT